MPSSMRASPTSAEPPPSVEAASARPISCPLPWRHFGVRQPQHVHHGIDPRPLAAAPEGGLDGAPSEDATVGRAVGKLNALTLGGEDDGVFADVAATAQNGKSDSPAPARARVTIARAHADALELDAAAFGRRTAEHQGRPGGGVDLVAMMHLKDFDVPI